MERFSENTISIKDYADMTKSGEIWRFSEFIIDQDKIFVIFTGGVNESDIEICAQVTDYTFYNDSEIDNMIFSQFDLECGACKIGIYPGFGARYFYPGG